MSNKEIDSHLDYIFDLGNSLLCNGEYTTIDKILYNTDVETTPNYILIAWLTISKWADKKLWCRDAFYEKCLKKIDKKTLEGLE